MLYERISMLCADRAVSIACLAETTTTDATTEYFQIGTLMDDLRGRNDGLGWSVSLIQVLHDPLGPRFRCAIEREDGFQCAILVVRMAIGGRHINTINF